MIPHFTGQCACGAVTATIAGEPVATRQCWCRQCQQIAAGSPTLNAIFAVGDVTLEGEVASSSYVAASGNTLTHGFCGKCGTPVFAASSARPQFRTFRLGFLDPGHGIVPQMAIWTDEAPDGAVFQSGAELFPGQPPAPAPVKQG